MKLIILPEIYNNYRVIWYGQKWFSFGFEAFGENDHFDRNWSHEKKPSTGLLV